MKSFRGLWADHGDAMSMLYAGTRYVTAILFVSFHKNNSLSIFVVFQRVEERHYSFRKANWVRNIE